ncbi:hypothetical protein [Streptococcus acidominimus]|uniref:Uncharacterized protein n=1 Tax=Streptococcus acidominimus TaxID=1326 RepID=A0A1Q8E627_STRAI|nr:hypothetical protein [Streptococcus acidominimus]OLF47242.1 hypothetical protein BU200_10290 [Streptococcus acidominimus]SUN05882.1 Uncharacterised protein [Streptococcus acidominimus]SUN07266.1 Uncharacterised protein [Streptococcus acidominimus]
MTPLAIDRSWQSGNERADNLFFWRSFGFDEKDVLTENTDGIVKGTLFEFKNSIADLNIVLVQAIHYLSKLRNKGGIPIPSKIVLVDISKDHAYVYDATQYRSEILQNYTNSASKNVKQLTLKNATKPEKEFDFAVFQPNSPKNGELIELFQIDKYQKFDINFPNILGWANYIYHNDRSTSKSQMFDMLRNPVNSIIEDYILPWNGDETDFDTVMDALNDPANRKDLGAFYTLKEATKLVRQAISSLPKGKDYVIIDRCAGTGALEHYLTDEELSHVVLNTYEIKEWLVLYNKYIGKVRAIIPPLTVVQSNKGNLVSGGDALAKEFLNIPMETDGKHATLQEIIDDKNVAIIGFENPPYSNELARAQEGSVKSKDKFSYIRKLMSAEFTGDSSHAKDLLNQFVWSFEKYFMRNEYDYYVLFAPVKYWKSVGLMQKTFVDGFLANRGNFKAQESSVLVAQWKNEADTKTESLTVPAKEIWKNDKKWGTGKGVAVIDVPENAILKDVKHVTIRKVYKTLGEYYSKKVKADVLSKIATGYDGKEVPLKSYGKPVYNDNILAVIEASGFGITPQDIRMTRIAIYHGRGSQVRTTNYAEQTVLFVAKQYPQRNWYEKDIYYTTSDKGDLYKQDTDFLRKATLWTCISHKNHCLSFEGSDGRFYNNEMCLDENSLVRKELIEQVKYGKLDRADLMLLGVFDELLELAKDTPEYNSKYHYGTYQIELDINTSYKDGNGKKIFNNEKVNTKLKELKVRLSDYYDNELESKLFEYELLK